MRSAKLMWAGMLVGLGLTLSGARDASACGGTFVPPTEDDSPVTAHRMILSPGKTIRYAVVKTR